MKKNIQICWLANLQTFSARFFLSFLLVLLIHKQMLAQFSDDFSDNDLTNSPAWTGDINHFEVAFNRLHLRAPEEDSISFLSTPCGAVQNASWEFRVQLEFNPSSSNYARVYVISDEMDLSGSLNGYFVMIGGNRDEVSLYKQTGTSYLKIIDGRDGVLNASTVILNIKVTSNNAQWQLLTDIGLTGDYVTEGTNRAEIFLNASHFGVHCNYTATRADKFYFDDFKITGDIVQDNLPPVLENVEAVSSNKLNLSFSESLDIEVASQKGHYVVDHTVGYPDSVTIDANDRRIVWLFFQADFPVNVTVVLTVSGIIDVKGNIMEPTNKNFSFYQTSQANFKDVIITEIFPDPSPSVGLPESEFVEIFNRSHNAFNLKGWQFSDPTGSASLPELIILPKEYVILTSQPSHFSHLPKVISLQNFPNLSNTADRLTLKNENSTAIDSVNYLDEWYKIEERSEGGWTLELIDPENLCGEGNNWIVSENHNGGSPGVQNSVFANKPDLTGPKLISAIPLTSKILQLKFDEKLDTEPPLTSNFDIQPPLSVSNVSFSNFSLTELHLYFDDQIQQNASYTITVNNISDCAGNLIQQEFTKAGFGFPETADSLDLVINEILFNPRPTGVDFVEIVNNSLKFINLKNWSIANIENGTLKDATTLTQDPFLFKPGGYLVLTENVDILKGEYSLSNEKNFLEVENLPGLSDDHGSVALVDSSGAVIDHLSYRKNMHSVFVKDEEGVSLERISLSLATNFDQNWKSCSGTVGFATPGYLNSNAAPDPSLLSEPLRVDPEIFDPISGQPDFTQVHYNFDQGGYVANVKIFDPQGHLIKQLANNDVLGTSGFYRWDGDRDDGSKARVGYYMIWFEIFDAHGMTRKYQKRVAVATKF